MKAMSACIASNATSDKPKILGLSIFDQNKEGSSCEFKIHREYEVSVTSTLFCGGDWQWQLCSARGHVLAGAGGFGTERECREAVNLLKSHAAVASITVVR